MLFPVKSFAAAACMAALLPGPCQAQALAQLNDSRVSLLGANVQKRANGVLSLLAFSVVPDLTTSSLSIDDKSAGSPTLSMMQMGGGATFSKAVPLYLEGSIAFSRYDPTFVATDGQEERSIPTKWTSVAATGGIGWDFPIADELVFRPIINISLGKVASDLAVGEWYLGRKLDRELDFLNDGTLNALGYGGSVMLDYEHYRETYEVDVEWRYTWIHLESFGGTQAVQGNAEAQATSLWARYRAPIPGWHAMGRPVRYVLEAAHTTYLGDQRDILGFTNRSSLGLGMELDTSAYHVYATRLRAVLRYMFGNNVHGVALGLAASF